MDNAAVIIAVITGGLAIAGILGRTVVRPLRHMARRADQFWTDWNGEAERPGHDAQPGVLERLQGIERRQAATEAAVEAITHELRPNSGESLRDAVDRVERAVRPSGK